MHTIIRRTAGLASGTPGAPNLSLGRLVQHTPRACDSREERPERSADECKALAPGGFSRSPDGDRTWGESLGPPPTTRD